MTGLRLIDWAVLAVSFFNTMLLLWLGLTVLLNAERRTWGVWLAGGGLLMAAAFLVSHSAIVAQGLRYVSLGMTLWWHTGWLLAVALPFSWYALILWYAGFWESPLTPLRSRHQPWFLLTATWALGLVGLLVFANPFPSYSEVVLLRLANTPSIGGLPLLGLAYPLYVLLCIVLALDVLGGPSPSERMMGDLARRRARPWLTAASLVLLAVSGLVAWAVLWIMLNARARALEGLYSGMALTLAGFDLVIDSLIAVAILLLGQAVVSYEIFTGKTLPRRGLLRQWRVVVALAAASGALTGISLTSQFRPVNGLLLTTALMGLVLAVLSRQSYAERQRYIDHLRPFVASQRLYDRFLVHSPAPPLDVDSVSLFQALCRDLLGARVGCLVPLGPLASLAGPPLTYPADAAVPLPTPGELAARLASPDTMCLPLGSGGPGGAQWAVPLWSERGLIGALILGDKRDGGLYSQEEIEIARASGERLLDVRASAELARRLMDLQRRRLAESQVLDRRTRRTLHDEILPRLHTVILHLSGSTEGAAGSSAEVLSLLADVHREISDLLREMPAHTHPEVARLGLTGALRQAVEDEFGHAFDGTAWQVEPRAEARARELSPVAAEVLFHAAREAVRNAALHGRGGDAARPLHLRVAVTWRGGLEIAIADDGVGLGAGGEAHQGGQGLDLHSTMMAVIGGSLAVESMPGGGTRVSLFLPGDPERKGFGSD